MSRRFELDTVEARVLGVLIEKQHTTPEQYPLSLNVVVAGCNQRSSRDPVLELGADEVAAGLDRLREKGLCVRVFPSKGRVERYRHCSEGHLGEEPQPAAIVAALLLAGPQTPGELRQRAGRMAEIDSLAELDEHLGYLMELDFVRRLPPAPGSRAERYEQLVAPDLHPEAAAVSTAPPAAPDVPSPPAAGAELEARVEALESEVERLRRRLDDLVGPE